MIAAQYRNAGRLPSAEQMLLLRAALLPGPEARKAALAWLAAVDIDRIDLASQRLLPLLHGRLRELEIEDPRLPMIQGIKKRAWYINTLLLRRAGEVLGLLTQAGIEAMALKGIALTIAYYRDASVRPTSDVDLMVRYHDAPAALETLRRGGWRILEGEVASADSVKPALTYAHAMHLVNPLGQDLDLHWHLLTFSHGADTDADFWAASSHITVQGQPVRILDPADQLLHVCVHGSGWDLVSPIRWIPDALVILRTAPQLDWDRLFFQAQKRQLTLIMSEALKYLQQNFGDCVPPPVLSRFADTQTSRFERREYSVLRNPATGFLGYVPRTFCGFLRITEGKSQIARALLIPDFLCWQYRVRRRRQLPMVLLRKVVRRLPGLLTAR